MDKTIKAIVFDLGNTLVKIDYLPFLINMGIDSKFTEDEIYEFLAEPTREYESGKIDAESMYRIVNQRLGTNVDFEQFKFAWCSVATNCIDGMDSLIVTIRQDYPIYLLSNTNEIHFEYIIKKFPLIKNFKEYYLSYKIGYLKPDIEIYTHLLEQLNLSPSEIVFIDDKNLNVLKAQELGIKAHKFLNSENLIKYLKSLKVMR